MSKKNSRNLGAQIMAVLALFGIIIGIVGTAILFIFDNGTNTNTGQELSQEELQELIKQIESSNSGTVVTGSGGELILTNSGSEVTSTGETTESNSGTISE